MKEGTWLPKRDVPLMDAATSPVASLDSSGKLEYKPRWICRGRKNQGRWTVKISHILYIIIPHQYITPYPQYYIIKTTWQTRDQPLRLYAKQCGRPPKLAVPLSSQCPSADKQPQAPPYYTIPSIWPLSHYKIYGHYGAKAFPPGPPSFSWILLLHHLSNKRQRTSSPTGSRQELSDTVQALQRVYMPWKSIASSFTGQKPSVSQTQWPVSGITSDSLPWF